MKKNVLAKKILSGLLVLAIFLIASTGFFVSENYEKVRLGHYKNLAFSYTRTLASVVDGDKVKQYIETGETDEYYDDMQVFFDSFALESDDIWYAYVIQPTDENFMYIWDAKVEDDQCPFGYIEEYSEGGREIVETMFKQDPSEEVTFLKTPEYGYIATAYSPIFDSEGNPVALAGVDISAPDIEKEQRMFVKGLVIAIGIIIVIAYVIFFAVVRRKIVKPIEKIDSAARSFVKNIEESEKLNLEIHTHDEIEGLSKSFEEMSTEIKDYITELSTVTAEKERIGAELNIATEIQAGFLPTDFNAFVGRSEFNIYATMTPAKEVGGDFYDFFFVDDSHIAIVVADVSGKGVPAALFMVISKTLIHDHTTQANNLGEVFEVVNNMLCENNPNGFFTTGFLGVLDLKTGEFEYVNAGHEPIYLRRDGGDFEMLKPLPGLVLAGMDGTKYKSATTTIKPGDRIFEYTDGVTEATNAHNELFEFERLGASLNKHKDLPAKELLIAVKADIDEFVGEAPQFDDLTMLCLDFKEYMK